VGWMFDDESMTAIVKVDKRRGLKLKFEIPSAYDPKAPLCFNII